MANEDRRIIVYPDYINSKKTVAQGRRIPLDKACEWPTIPELLDCCIKGLKLAAEAEPKRYPRNWCPELGREFCYGRLRVALRGDDGKPINPDVPTRRELLLKLAELVPLHPERQRKPGGKGDAGAGSSSSGAAGGGGGKGGSSKKGGKKKR